MKTIILCGGSGTRLWPLSRTLYPKQFYPLFEGHSLFQQTIQRNIAHTDEFIIIVNEEQYFMADDQFKSLQVDVPATFILEPVGRNTAPAIALGAFKANPDDILLVSPSDHLIHDSTGYAQVIKRAQGFALSKHLVTFGIKPTHPETGFGYIEAQNNDVKSFKEKPDLATAEKYFKSGHHFWNSGLFCFRAQDYLDNLKTHSSEIYESSLEAWNDCKQSSPYRVKRSLMEKIPSDSIDYAVMEKTKNIKVVPADIGWSDLGSFDSLYESLPKDPMKNTIDKQHISLNSHNNLIVSGKRIVATIDIDNLIIVDTPDAILISKKGSSQKVKDVVQELKNRKSELTNLHTTAHRPWGSYTILEDAPNFKVKRIVVKPGARLSLQKHAQRSEHWVVVDGRAFVTVGEKTFPLERNESTYIPIGEVHRLENREQSDLILIEAQVGTYLGEDDIVRLIDDYQRN